MLAQIPPDRGGFKLRNYFTAQKKKIIVIRRKYLSNFLENMHSFDPDAEGVLIENLYRS